MHRLAAVACIALFSSTALAQTTEGAPAAADDPRAAVLPPSPTTKAAETSDLLVPTPDEWRSRYESARSALVTGEFADASKQFAALEATAVNRVDRALAHAHRVLAEEWASRGLAFVARAQLGESTASAKAVDKRTIDELAVLYTNAVLYGVGSGVWLGVQTEPKDAAGGILPALALTGASVGTVVALDSGRGLRYGVAQSISTGMYIGLEHGIAWAAFAGNARGGGPTDKQLASIVWGFTTAGAIGGGLVGQLAGTTPGRSSWVGSTALWSGGIVGMATGALGSERDSERAVFAAAGVGLSLGTVAGLLTASSVSPSIARVRFVDLGGVSGGLLAGGLYAAFSGDDIDGRALSGVAALGAGAGLVTAWLLTGSMADDRPASRIETAAASTGLASARPTVMPAAGGAMLGLGGRL